MTALLAEQSIADYMEAVGRRARAASRLLAATATSTADKNRALLAMAEAVADNCAVLLEANREDMAAARRENLAPALLDRLQLTDGRIAAMAEGLRQVAALDDPVGAITDVDYRPSGIRLGRMRVPIGVIGIIYESRPNVTCDAAALCLKSGNAAILRGGSEAIASNQAIAACIGAGLQEAGLPAAAVQVLERQEREAVGCLITMPEYVDVVVPRGGRGLIERISREATVPVIKHLDGNCHIYIDDGADLDMALKVTVNAKTQRIGTCCTLESLLVAEGMAAEVLPPLVQALAEKEVELRGCEASRAALHEDIAASMVPAQESDWSAEYLAPILSIKVVAGLDEAIAHINRYGSGHTDSIITESRRGAHRFLREVDSGSVMVNASTRFADGFEYGLGAEIGISTDKLHARGPVGLEGLTSQKFVVLGDGHIRS